MNINLLIETILLLIAILVSNGLIYSLTIFNIKKRSFSDSISVIRNNSEKDLTLFLAGSFISSISSQSLSANSAGPSNSSQSLSEITSGSSSDLSTLVNSTSSDTNVDEDIIYNIIELDIGEEIITQTQLPVYSPIPSNLLNNTTEYTTADSLTILNNLTVEQWRQSLRIFHDFPVNTPAGILQEFKLDELNILYSQDIILYAITQTELRLIIELIPSWQLFDPNINHLILTIMSYYHL